MNRHVNAIAERLSRCQPQRQVPEILDRDNRQKLELTWVGKDTS